MYGICPRQPEEKGCSACSVAPAHVDFFLAKPLQLLLDVRFVAALRLLVLEVGLHLRFPLRREVCQTASTQGLASPYLFLVRLLLRDARIVAVCKLLIPQLLC